MHRSVAFGGMVAMLTCAVLAGCGGSSGSPSTSPPGGSVSVKVAPSSFTMGVGSNYRFAAAVTGTSNTAVNWQVNGAEGGNAGVGTIDSTGLYIAPGAIPSGVITVAAIAQADGVTNGTSVVTLALTDPVGTATGHTITCPSGSGITIGGTCYSIALSCPGIADLNGYLWVNQPPLTPIGAVLLTAGGNSEGLYADPNIYIHGADVVNGLLAASYITVQTSFGGLFTTTQPSGWQTGPGGIRRVACRYITLAQWVQQNIGPSGKSLCATGNSSGSILISYALAHYGGTSMFNMVEPTSGSPISRLDYSCECNQLNLTDPCDSSQQLTQCAGPMNAQKYIDPAYPAPICSQAVQSHSTANTQQFLSDSILSPEGTLSYPNTSVHFVWGGQDFSSAPVMGQEWQQKITTTNTASCVADAPHNLADVLDGAQKIVSDIVTYCHP
ncbi:MAG: hypothetical protein JWQ87_457 [Candidatus Sulfotelmatobacter sp.]|nr:hypothetical protein [Candidatus Sulfotelmatobacter sp.]